MRRMKKMKIAYAFVAVAFVAFLSIASVKATLEVGVEVAYPTINQGESQLITVLTNEPGIGLLIVLQPAMGDSWTDFLIAHPELAALFADLSPEMQTQLQGLIGDKIVSYKLIGPIPEEALNCVPISIPVMFPDDFTGINGEPSTTLVGDYKVIFVYLSNYEEDAQVAPVLATTTEIEQPTTETLVELDFACGRWFVIPEFALGTIAPILSSLTALPIAKRYYKRKHA